MTPDEAMQTLLAKPDHFIKYYPILIHALPAAPLPDVANLAQYKINKVDSGEGKNPAKPAHLGATRPGLLGIKRQISSFVMMAGADKPGNTRLAHVVPMVNHNSTFNNGLNLEGDVTAMPHFVVDGGGAGLMVTGQLSGCCFAWTTQGSDLWCVHVKPTGSEQQSIQLQQALTTSGRFAQAPQTPLSTYGRSDYPDKATVIGVRQGGSWKLYCQTGPTGMKTITGAYQLYPGAKRPL